MQGLCGDKEKEKQCQKGGGGPKVNAKNSTNLQKLKENNPEKSSKLITQCQSDYEKYSQEYSEAGHVRYTDPRSYQLQMFNPYDLPEDGRFSIMLWGKRRTGKSFWLKWYLEKRKDDFDELYVFTRTKINGWYQKFIPDCFVYDDWNEDLALKLLERAKRKTLKGKEVRMFVILDDMMSNKEMKTDEVLNQFYTLGRHAGITVAYLCQKFKGAVTDLRDNSDLCVVFTQFNTEQARQIAMEIMGRLNKATAIEMIDMYAHPTLHTCLIIETWRNSLDPEEFLKIGCADESCMKVGDIGSKKYLEKAKQKELERQLQTEIARQQSKGPRESIRALDELWHI